MSQHTPGPWEVSPSGVLIGTAADPYQAIATIIDGHGSVSPCELAPNARLIAAAPELLQALQALLSYTEACEGLLNASPAGQVIAARNAIAKATGGAQ